MNLSFNSLARMIDHSLLHPTLNDKAISDGCRLAKKYGLASACVKPYATAMARDILAGSAVAVCSVIAFPHGNSATRIKLREADQVLGDGATEIDMVINIGKVLGEDWEYVSEEIKHVNDVVLDHKAILKVIFENDYLEDSQILRLCEICASHAVAFVKTSTGYGFVKQANGTYSYKGATDHDLRLMRSHCPDGVQVKAAGGIRNLEDLLRVRDLGVTRVGATATEAILQEAKKRGFH